SPTHSADPSRSPSSRALAARNGSSLQPTRSSRSWARRGRASPSSPRVLPPTVSKHLRSWRSAARLSLLGLAAATSPISPASMPMRQEWHLSKQWSGANLAGGFKPRALTSFLTPSPRLVPARNPVAAGHEVGRSPHERGPIRSADAGRRRGHIPARSRRGLVAAAAAYRARTPLIQGAPDAPGNQHLPPVPQGPQFRAAD